MGKYRLKAGNYRDRVSGKLYHGPTEGKPVGDVVESAHDLAALFPHKFIRLTKAAAAKVKPKKPPIPSVDEVKGETVEDEHELVEIPEEEEIEEEEIEEEEDEDEDEDEAPGDSSVVIPEKERKKRIKELVRVYGKNVTKTYRPEATECGVLIFKDNTKQYTVVDADDLQPLKEETMTRKGMRALLKELG